MARTQTVQRKRCVELAKKIAKERDSYTCQKCGHSKQDGWKIDGSHVVPETWQGTCANPKNIIALCSYCHTTGRDSWHQSPLAQDWFHEKFPGLYDQLYATALAYSQNPFPKIDWEEEHNKLKNQVL